VIRVILATFASYGAGWAIGVPLLVPILNSAMAWWVMADRMRTGQTRQAIALMLVWAAVMAVSATAMAALGLAHDAGDEALFLRDGYRDEMLSWVRTGAGAESTPSVFLPRHGANAAVFTAAALATGGLLAMPMGAVLVNSMGEYVGAMAAASAHPWTSVVLGWHPWAIVRVIAFVVLGVVLSGVLLSRVLRFPYRLADQRRWVGVSVGLLVLDVALKVVLAPAWGRLLRGVAGW
jgi:hypothetical protein